MKANKESALKALAKRPKLFAAIEKGTEFHKLKTVGQVSGGFVRSLMWAGIAEKDENGIVTFVKGIKKTSLPSLEPEEKKPKKKGNTATTKGPTTKVPKKALDKLDSRKKSSKKDLQSDVEVSEDKPKKGPKEGSKKDEPLTKKEQRQADKAERIRIRAEKKVIKDAAKAEKAEAGKPGPVMKKAKGKLLRPVKGLPANHKIEFEYQDGFWWASDKNERFRIATTNIKFE